MMYDSDMITKQQKKRAIGIQHNGYVWSPHVHGQSHGLWQSQGMILRYFEIGSGWWFQSL